MSARCRDHGGKGAFCLGVVVLLWSLLAMTVLADPVPTATLAVPGESFIGENFTFTVTFDNTSPTDPGYGPYIDLIFPVTGQDGDDGVDFVNATYLGAPVTAIQLTFPVGGCVNHPYAVDTTGAPVQVCGTPGDKLVVLQLPFGSFTNDQPPAQVTVNATLSNKADLGVPLAIQARAGFQYGRDPLNNPTTDPSIIGTWTSQSVTPILMTLTKTYIGPEDETATGPNYPRQYRLTVNIASGQTITNLNVIDLLPNNLQFLRLVSATPSPYTVVASPPLGAPQNPPTSTLMVQFPSVTGGAGNADAVVVLEYFVPEFDADGRRIIDASTGDDVLSLNNASADGYWKPIDLRDPLAHPSIDAPPPEHILTDKSIAIQKSVRVVKDLNHPGPTPGDTLEYTLDFQISDYFTFDDLIVVDKFSDGQRFDATFIPTFTVTDRAGTTTGTFTDTLTVDTSQYEHCGDGSTTLTFRLSQAMVQNGAPDGILVGGRAISPDAGPATGRIVFRTVIQNAYTCLYPSGEAPLDQGDSVGNAVTITGEVLVNGTPPTPQTPKQYESDDSHASISVAQGALSKTIYARNGSTSGDLTQFAPGDTITYRLRFSLPSSDVEQLSLTDYLPLPVFRATELVAFDDVISATPPAAGRAHFGPAETFRTISGIVPTLTTDATANSARFFWGDYDDPANRPSEIDILFTVTVRDDPFADGLFLTNQVRESDRNTELRVFTRDAIVQFKLTEPVLKLTKGVVASDNPKAQFSPATVGPVSFSAPGGSCPRFSGTIHSTNLAAHPINSNVSKVDAGDRVTFAIVVENIGSGLHGAYDIVISDTLPAELQVPSAGLNLCVTDGTGAPIAYTDLGGGLFGQGIRLNDPGPTATPEGALDPYDATSGRNIAIITYDLEVKTSARALGNVINTAILANYSSIEGGQDYTPTDLTDTATVTIAPPGARKTLDTSEIVNTINTASKVVIGELVTYTLTITVPEGTTPGVTVVDTLDSGLAFVAFHGLTNSNPGQVTFTGSITPVITNSGRTVTFNLGTITNTNTNNTVAETLSLTYRAVVLNVSGNQNGTKLNNSAVVSWGGGSLAAVSAPDVTVIEPVLDTAKTAQVGSGGTTGDAGDPIT
jgi:fimbrial isopeptide formation D2 family protein/uncharacterized repeat protein (TIGR01451 family)